VRRLKRSRRSAVFLKVLLSISSRSILDGLSAQAEGLLAIKGPEHFSAQVSMNGEANPLTVSRRSNRGSSDYPTASYLIRIHTSFLRWVPPKSKLSSSSRSSQIRAPFLAPFSIYADAIALMPSVLICPYQMPHLPICCSSKML